MDMSIHTGRYGMAAQRAAELARKGWDPTDAWQSVVTSIFSDSRAYQMKGCPKSAFLGLAEAGQIDGVPAGKYTASTENKRYAIDALRLLLRDSTLASRPEELWRLAVKNASIKHNEQMNVVIALWQIKAFICQRQAVS